MIRRVADFMIAPCETVEAITGLLQVKLLFLETRQDCFPVVETGGQVIGILTWQDIIQAHPNRIVADAMSGRFVYVEQDMPLWRAREILTREKLSALLVSEDHQLKGMVTTSIIKQELGKHIDLLTGLYRKDYIYYHALKLMASGSEMSIIFADLDKFGEINKQYGHIKGNTILKEFSVFLQAHIPPEAFLCRFGGDEFIILMSCPRESVTVFLHNLRQVIEEYTFSDGIPVTMSIGVATASRMSDRSLPLEQLLAMLINQASLASTSAKKDNSGIKILEPTKDSESA